MDKEQIKKALLERFNNLEPELQEAIMSSDYEKNLFEIAQKHKLTVSQMADFELNTTLVMIGDTHPDQYVNELMVDLKISQDEAFSIVDDVNEKIMKNIRDILRGNFEREDEEEEAFLTMPLPAESVLKNQGASTELKDVPKPEYRTIQNEIIHGIKNDSVSLQSDINMFKEKLDSITTSKNKVTDYSTSAVNNLSPKEKVPLARALPIEPTTETLKKHDPYHEAI